MLLLFLEVKITYKITYKMPEVLLCVKTTVNNILKSVIFEGDFLLKCVIFEGVFQLKSVITRRNWFAYSSENQAGDSI